LTGIERVRYATIAGIVKAQNIIRAPHVNWAARVGARFLWIP
jgi:hypothetical protein